MRKHKLISKHQKGKVLTNNSSQDGTYVLQSPLSLEEQLFIRLSSAFGRPPTEAEMIQDERSRQANIYLDNTGIIQEGKEDNAKNNFFRGYNNFRYSHPWAKGLNWTPIIGDVMDGISLAGDLNNKNYVSAGIGAGLLLLPNVILKPLLKGVKTARFTQNVIDELSPQDRFIRQMYINELEGNGDGLPIHIKDNIGFLTPKQIDFIDNLVLTRMRNGNYQTDKDVAKIRHLLQVHPYYSFTNDYFKKAGKETMGGWYQPWDDRIVYNTSEPSVKVLPHEYRHLLDSYYPLNNSNKVYLRRAYKDYFTNFDLTSKDGFKNDISAEMVTTNLDGRIELFRGKKVNYDGKEISLASAPIDIQNRFISHAYTEEILNALNNSNGYGHKFVEFLKNKGDEYIYQKIPHIKQAMKRVPAIIPFGLMSYRLQKEKEKHKQGGQLVPKNKSGNPIKKQESVRDNTNVAQKPLNWALKEMINNPQDYDSYEKLISYKGRAKHEDPKKITPRKNTRPVPRSITNGRHKNNA